MEQAVADETAPRWSRWLIPRGSHPSARVSRRRPGARARPEICPPRTPYARAREHAPCPVRQGGSSHVRIPGIEDTPRPYGGRVCAHAHLPGMEDTPHVKTRGLFARPRFPGIAAHTPSATQEVCPLIPAPVERSLTPGQTDGFLAHLAASIRLEARPDTYDAQEITGESREAMALRDQNPTDRDERYAETHRPESGSDRQRTIRGARQRAL